VTHRALRPYRGVLAARLRTLLQYRAAALAGFATQLFWGFLKIMVLEAFYLARPEAQPMSFAAVAAYVWLGQALLGMLPWNVDRDIDSMVRTGTVAYDLLRPIDAYGHWYARALAWRVATPALRAPPLVLVAAVVLPLAGLGGWALAPPPSWAAAGAWAAAQAVALAMSAAITTALNISLVWTISGQGVRMLVPHLVTVLSGMIVPLPILPPAIERIVMMLPFAYLIDVPYRLYSGDIPAAALPACLAAGLAWTAVIVALGRLMMGSATRRLVVQGG
jgi:ABC-2 type transport system permease protein